jgi:hypothetical protein
MIGFIIFIIIAAFTGWYFYFKYHNDTRVKVPPGFVAWDGEMAYGAGEHFFPFEYKLVDIEERITTFGVDVLGTVSIVDTDYDESISSHDDGYTEKGYFAKSGGSSKSGNTVVRTRQREHFKHRYVFVWKPNIQKIGTYLKQPSIPEAIARLLRTMPEIDLEKYADYLGIVIVSTEGIKPASSSTTGVAIGEGIELPYESRLTHVYILGKSGMGKSTLLTNIIRQDILAGKGVAVIDPHGDLIDRVVPYIPKSRLKDVVYFDPVKSPIGINAFQYSDEAEKGLVAEDLFVLFRRITGEGGVRMDAILKRAIQLLLETEGAVFFDIYRIFTDDQFRFQLAQKAKDPDLKDFWNAIWPKYPHPATEEPLITRMMEFSTKPYLKATTACTSPLSFFDVIQRKKIFLGRIARHDIGPTTSSVLGALLVSQFQVAAFRQGKLHPSKRVPFYLFIDEFQNFKSSAFNEIITEARKYQLGLTVANQRLGDLDEQTRASVRGGVETSFYFRPFDEDATAIAKTLGKFPAESLLDLEKFQAVVRQGNASSAEKIFIDLPPEPGKGNLPEILENTKREYPSSFPVRTFERKGKDSARDDVEPGLPPE